MKFIRNLRTFLAVTLIVCILLGTCYGAQDGSEASADMTTSATDIVEENNANIENNESAQINQYDEAIRLIRSLGILTNMEDGTFQPDQVLTRAELAVAMVKFLGLEDAAKSVRYIFFEDVFEDDPAAGAISLVFSMGLFNGYGDGTFGPEEPVIFEHAIKILVAALGYEPLAKERGGYPYGYLSIATQLGITKKVNGKIGEPLIRGMFSQLLYNSMTVYMLEREMTTGGISYNTKSQKTILNTVFDAIESNGVVVASGKTSLYGESSLKDDEVLIGSTIYKVGETNAADYLGYRIDFYYKEAEGEWVLLMAYPNEKANNVLEINAENIYDVTGTAGGQVEYYVDIEKSDRTATASFAEDMRIIYNGRAVKSGSEQYTKELLQPEMGSLKLIDNDGDDKYDVVYVTDIKTYVAGGVDKKNNLVFLKYNRLFNGKANIKLDPDDKDLTFSIIKNGKPASINSISEWDVLSVAADLEFKNIDVIVSGDKVTGTITEYSLEDGIICVTVEEKVYKTIPGYYGDPMHVKDNGTLYLDANGKIAAFKKDSGTGLKYAFFIRAGMPTGVKRTVEFQFFTTAGETVVYESREKIFVKGIGEDKYYDAVDVADWLWNPQENRYNSQVVMYDIDSDGKLCELHIAHETVAVGYDEDRFSQDFDKNNMRCGTGNQEGMLMYKEIKGQFGENFIITDSTIIFNLNQADPTEQVKPEDLSIVNKSAFKNDNWYNVKMYDASPTGVVTVMLNIGTAASQLNKKTAPMMLVDKVTKYYDEVSGEQRVKVYGYVNGERKELLVSDKWQPDTSFKLEDIKDEEETVTKIDENGNVVPVCDFGRKPEDFKSGDVILYETNAKGEMSFSRLVFETPDANTKQGRYDYYNGGRYNWEYCSLYATANAVDPTTSTFTVSWPSVVNPNKTIKKTMYLTYLTIYMYNRKTKEISVKSISDIVTEQQAGENAYKVFLREEFFDAKVIIMYDPNDGYDG